MTTAFVTGPTGCIGAATVEYLLDHGVDRVVGMSRKRDFSRIAGQYHDRLEFMEGDITSLEQVQSAMMSVQPQCIIHLAALQTPDCMARPLQGMEVNVVGTRNVVQAAAELGDSLRRLVLASSSAVYGPRDMYPGETVATNVPYLPPNLYGYWKVCNEGMGQAFHRETGISTVCIRLSTCYGPGRDLGMTSAPTAMLKCVAAGESFRMPYQGREHFHFVRDVGAGFAEAAISEFAGYGVFNLRGITVHTEQFIEVIRAVAVELGMEGVDVGIESGAQGMPFVNDLDAETSLAAFPKMPLTTIEEGIRISLQSFQEMAEAGSLDASYQPAAPE
ncbi:MAG: NAD-dependent epimerase/dehydratase family protein [Planctomycetaceae bacterium]